MFLGKDDDDDEKRTELEYRLERLRHFLLIPKITDFKFTGSFRKEWNADIEMLLKKKNFKNLMERLLDIDLSERLLKNILVSTFWYFRVRRTLTLAGGFFTIPYL